MRPSLRQAINFHGHLGPYLVLGLLAGELALKKLKAKKYFAITVKAIGATKKPKSCLIDGLQLSTGATFGKGNISRRAGKEILIEITHKADKEQLRICLREKLIDKLNSLKGHRDSRIFARQLWKARPKDLFLLEKA